MPEEERANTEGFHPEQPEEEHYSEDSPEQAIRCPECGCGHCPVVNTYHKQILNTRFIRRRRTCRYCEKVFYTREALEEEEE